jgi:micrococcal nuclease
MFSAYHNLRSFTLVTLLATTLLVATTGAGQAKSTLEGPIPALVTRIIDGDTIKVRAQIWLEQEIVVRVRLAGVDAPEMTAPCEGARKLAEEARSLVVREIEGARVILTHIHGGKYFGRVIGRVQTPKGDDLSTLLLEAGLAVPYSGGRRPPPCPNPPQ